MTKSKSKTAVETVKTTIDTGINALATLVNDFANIEGRIMEQVLAEIRLRVAYLGWKPAQFKDETTMKKERRKEATDFNKGRMAALLKELKARKYTKVLFKLTWRDNSASESVANAGAVQLTDISTRESGTQYSARYSNTHNTLNSSWLLMAWHNPQLAFNALKADDAIAKIHTWKAKYDSDESDRQLAKDRANEAAGNASGEADQAPPLAADAPPILGEAYNAAESFKRAASSFCDHSEDYDVLSEYIAQLQALASEIIELAAGDSDSEHVSDEDMVKAALAATS